MQPGDVYKFNFQFEPPEQGYSYRPAIILQVYEEKAIAIKVTHTEPTQRDPYRKKINNIAGSGLDDHSYAQYDWFNIILANNTYKKIGTLDTTEFSEIVELFNNYHSR